MQSPEPGRVEWNARDFGTIAHEILERWGRDIEARSLADSSALHAWLSAELDRVVGECFDKRPPLAVRVQTEALRQRLGWFAEVQARIRGDGWEVSEVEQKFEIPVGASVIVAKIDRIDRHHGSGQLRVIDYKTGKVAGVAEEHRKKISATTTLPAHLGPECPALFSGVRNGRPADFRWTNLQLPLYAVALKARDGIVPAPCYLTLGATEADVDLCEWTDFSEDDLTSSGNCAEWIVGRIAAGVFWPPAEKSRYDDFAALAAGRTLEEMCAPLAGTPS
jgi:hypothetical protein